MTVFEITAPDGRVLEIEGDKTPSESELNEIFKTVPQQQNNNVSNNNIGKWGETTISATPHKNLISDFANCLKWVNNTRVSAYQEGKNQVEIAGLETKDMFGRANQNDLQRLDELSRQKENTYGIPQRRKFVDNNETNFIPRLADTVSIGAKKGYVEALKMLPYMWETIKAGGIGSGVGALGGATIGTGVALATTKANAPSLALQGARLGATWGGRISGSMKLAELEGGLARNELRQINQEIIEKGGEPLSNAEINALAIGVGGVNAGLEMVSLKQMLKTVPGGEQVLEYLEKKNLRELAVNKTVREQLKGVLGQYAKTIGTEITTEMAQEATNIVADETARKLGHIEATPLEQNVARILDTGKATFGATLYLGGLGSAAKAVTIMGKQGFTRPVAEAKVAKMSAEEQQEFVANNLDTLFESAKDIPSVKDSENINEIKNHYFTQNLNAGMEKTEALAAAEVESNAAAIMSKQYGISLDEAKNRLALNVQSMSDEQAIAQRNSDVKVLQGGISMTEDEREQKELEQHNQSKFDRENIENNFGDSVENITSSLKNDVQNVITENNLDETEFNLQDAKIYGSYAKGKNKATSDLDIIVQYSGNMREDDAFNMFANAGLVITDKNGNEIKVDVNPINIDKSGTIEDNLDYFDSLDTKFQSIETAGASENNIKAAAKEWKEKGTDSKYFKKWFGDSKVVDESGKPLVVYHGSRSNFEVFEHKEGLDSDVNSINTKLAFFFVDDDIAADEFAEVQREAQIIRLQAEKHVGSGYNNLKEKQRLDEEIKKQSYNDNIRYNVYLSIQNPIIADFEGKEYETENVDALILQAKENGNDGVIIKNINDVGGTHTQYAVFSPEQIKSVDNQGTFDKNNPNIYYQSETNNNIVDLTNDFAKTPTIDEVKNYINEIIENGTKFATLSPNWFVDIKGGKRTTKKILNAGNYKKLEKMGRKRHNKYIMSLEKLLANAEYAGEKDNTKKDKKPNVEKYHYFKTDVKIGNKTYQLIFDTEEYKNDNKKSTSVRYAKRNLNKTEVDTNSISDNAENINPKTVHLYNIKEIKNTNTYFQSAYHGSPHKFDEFSLDAIGTGEGAQAHGWGLYFAGDKNVSENYRKKLAQAPVNIHPLYKQLYINGGKLNAIKYIQDNLNTLKQAFNNAKTDNEKKEYSENIKNLEKQISIIEDFKDDNLGQLFEVDIPEIDEMLDEDKPFSEQSEKVQKALLELAKKEVNAPYGFERSLPELDARQIYNRLSNAFHGAKNASLKLNEYGIKGITYDGRQDGRCYVIFDDKAVNILKTYYQDLGDNSNSDIKNARGFTYRRYNFDGTVKDNLIVLLKNKSDKSTLLHEFAHVYLTTLNDLARDNAKAKADLLVVNKWLGFNGTEYTTSQHEKFANGFVAYVRTGKAPTYGLKKAFEQFKRWLNELYNDLVYSENIELDDGAKAVFDEILGGKSQEAVAEQIEDFVKKAENNALLRLRAENSEKQKLPPNVLSDYQRKYRDTAYNIVWYALSHIKKKEGGFEEPLVKDKRQLYMLLGNDSKINRKNKGVMKQAEKLEHILSECDDVFSGNDGFLSEWGEFFNDPGIGQDEGADTTLALTALDVIKQRKYLYETEKAIEGITDEDIKRAQYELDYILDEFKNNSDRDLVVAGFFDWVDKQPDFLQEDFITKWENTTNEIERYESLSKFEQAKEDLKLYAATLKGFGDYSWQFAEYARKVLKRLDFMTEHDKAKMFDKLKDFNSFREIERNLDDIMDYAETLNDVSLRRNLADTIVSEVKHTTPEIKNGTKKTRYDYRTNKLFERLRYLNKLTQEQVQDLYDAYVNGELERRSSQFEENGTIVGKTEDYFQDIENSFLQFKANGMYYNSTELLQTLLAKIQNAKFTGKVARDEMDFEVRMNQQNWINSCAKSLETHRGKNGKLEELYSMEANLDSMLSMLFDDNIKNQFSLDDLFAQVDGRVGKDREEILNKISKIFGFEGPFKDAMLNNKFIEMANEKYTIKQRYADKGSKDTTGVWSWEPIELSKMEILYYYIQAKNPVSYSMLTDMGDETHAPKGQFDKFEFDELLKNLSDQEKLMGDALQIAAEKYYNDLNKYHIKKHHIDLGKAMCYFPRKSELKEINELDLFNQYTEKSTNPKFVKMRSAGPSIRIAPANPINVLFNHIQKANTIIIMGDKLDLMNKVFRDNDLGQKIKSVFGENVYKEFMQHITENLYNGQAKTLSNAEGIISKLMSNIIGVPMFIKPQVGLKQIMGLINYGVGDEHVGTIEWMKAFTKVIKNPKSAIDFMMQDEYLKDRLTRGNMNEAMKNQIDNKLTSKLSLLTDYFSLNMRYGDLFNLTLGGKAYIDVLMDKGYTKTQAFELFRKKTISDQQSSISSTLSNLQRNSKNNPFARLLFAYQNTPHQYFRICADAIIKAKQGKISKTQAIKTTFIYWWFLPFIFNMAGSLSPLTLLATGNPDELINDALIACLGSISCIPFFGEMGRALFAGVTGSEYFGNKDWFTRANEAIVKPMNKYRKGNLNFEDILKSLEIFAQGFGIPLEEIDTQLEAIGDYAQGDFAKGFIKTLGYSRYRADAVTGEK